jgi:thioredoxin reductase
MGLRERYEIVVLGAGPSGISAALTIAQSIDNVLLVDQNDHIGGHLSFHTRNLVGPSWADSSITGEEWCRLKYRELTDLDVNLLLGTKVDKICKDGKIFLRQHNELSIIHSSLIIAALGSDYIRTPFKGSDLTGIMTIQAAQEKSSKLQQNLPEPVCIIGGNSSAFDVGLTHLENSHSSNVTILEEGNKILADPEKVLLFKEKGGAILVNKKLISAIGNKRIQAIRTRDCNSENNYLETLLPVASLVLSPWRTPSIGLLTNCDCNTTYCNILGGEVPIHDYTYRTTNSRIYAVGDLVGVENGSVAIEQGIIAGLMSLKDLGKPHDKHNFMLSKSEQLMTLLHSQGFGLERKRAREEIIYSSLVAG